jgi:tRNA modification GTPase
VADLIHAATDRAREMALSQLAGALSRRLRALAERIADAAAEVEARVDFAEDVGGVEVPPHVRQRVAELSAELASWLASAPYARAVRDGARVPIVGRPNVGKSSLFNALVGEDRAIVTPLPGTTRDRVSETLEIEGVRVALSDTAGMRQAADLVEAQGVQRAEEALESAVAAIWVVDGACPLTAEDHAIAARLAGRRVVAVRNKSDLPPAFPAAELMALAPDLPAVAASARTGDGVPELRRSLASLLGAGKREGAEAAAIGNPRHVEALARAQQALDRAAREADREAPGEIVALELRESLAAIREVTGEAVGEDLLERIFSRFCVGK